ncbi:MAG: uroporphyrinogen decarboxylase family protein [Clostridia bacterium]|nr:uroporphyrinogen decarboxylase family protein [Clostridia bacterium]
MNGRERTIAFLEGRPVDHVPFHPLVMQYAAELTGVNYKSFCTDYRQQSKAMVEFARNYGLDWLHPAGWPYCEAIAYGLQVSFPEDGLPLSKEHLIQDPEEDLDRIRPLDIESSAVMMNRVEGVRYNKETVGDEFFLAAHCEGPLAEYTDLRGVENGLMDLIMYPDEVTDAMKIIVDNAKRWIFLQVQAGAECVSIGDAVCSQISESMYAELIQPLHKELADYIRSLGVYSKFHICGNITHLIPRLIDLGINIIDVDHMVDLKPEFYAAMRQGQCFCGNIDPVSQLRLGTPESICNAVCDVMKNSGGKLILASGCEVPKGTPIENYSAFHEIASRYPVVF